MDINQILDQAEDLHKQGKLQEAGSRYGAALSHSPENADALYGLGTILMQQKKYPKALEYLHKATSLQPDVPEFLFNLAILEEIVGDAAKAEKNYLHAAYYARNDDRFLLRICIKLIELGLARQALSYLKAIAEQTTVISVWQARAQATLGNWGETQKILKPLTVQFPDDPGLWREYSIAAGHMRDFEEALRAYHVYMDKKAADGNDFLGLADLYLMARRPHEAMTTLQKAFAGGVDSADAFLIAGKCARLEGDYDAARQNLTRAIDCRPTFGQAWQLLFEILDRSEISDLAAQCADLEKDENCRDRDRITLALAAGQAYAKTGRHNDAFQAFERANQDQKNQMAQRGLGYDPTETLSEFKKITGCYPKGASLASARDFIQQRPVFILGMPRTGTTLVEKILGRLAGVETGGENEALEYVARQYYREMDRSDKAAHAFLSTEQLEEMAAIYWQRTPS